MEKIKNFLKDNNINSNDTIVIACSGGPDSMFLLCSLKSLGYKVICSHVNHNVRSCSKDEYHFMETYCQKNNIIFEGMTIEKYNKDNFHNNAREIRYNFFETIVKKYNAKYLATAHHGDDLIETILMRLTRGSSINGYIGFKSITNTDNYILIRPLIKYTKDEILKKVTEQNIPYVIDQSNDSDKYTRNRYRHYILPILKEENPQVHLKYLEFNNELTELTDYLNSLVKEKVKKIYQNNTLLISALKKEHHIIQKEILRQIIVSIYKENTSLIKNTHITYLFNIINSSKPHQTLMFPHNIKVAKIYDKLIFDYKEKTNEPYYFELTKTITLPNNNTLEVLEHDINDTSNYCIRLNSKDLSLPLIVRTKQDGDKMIIKNMTKPKKIKEIFIENKIKLNSRQEWPIVTDSNNQIIWLPGLKKSNFDINKTDNYDIIIKYNLKGEKKSEQ